MFIHLYGYMETKNAAVIRLRLPTNLMTLMGCLTLLIQAKAPTAIGTFFYLV
jgi:hypothetical protein